MTTYVSIQGRGTVTIPSEIRRSLHLDEPGVQLEVTVRDGEIVLRPTMPVPAGQAWYWGEEWQAGERQAEIEKKSGDGVIYDSGDEFLASLD